MTAFREVACGLRFPEGPVVLPDGSVLVVEIAGGTLARIAPDGRVERVATTGGGPNGAALGPDGKVYVCNNGGNEWLEREGRLFPVGAGKDHRGGSIQRVDLATGAVETLYTHAGEQRLNGPNDIVFDAAGGFWFTDLGKTRGRVMDVGAIYYAATDGSRIVEAIYPFDRPNGVGLSPDGRTLYVAQTPTARLWAYEVEAPGRLAGGRAPLRAEKGRCLAGLGGYQMFDSLAVHPDGRICVATLVNGGITVIAPDGRVERHVPLPDHATTNVCFTPDGRTAYATLSSTGRLVALDWPAA